MSELTQLEIKTSGGKWLVNDKSFNEMSQTEKEILSKFIKQFEEE